MHRILNLHRVLAVVQGRFPQILAATLIGQQQDVGHVTRSQTFDQIPLAQNRQTGQLEPRAQRQQLVGVLVGVVDFVRVNVAEQFRH